MIYAIVVLILWFFLMLIFAAAILVVGVLCIIFSDKSEIKHKKEA